MSDQAFPTFITNEYGTWCPSCGEILSHRAEDYMGDQCPTCGYPDDIEAMAEYHDPDFEPEEAP